MRLIVQHNSVMGWDIGGAHVKVALAIAADSIAQIAQLPCSLWLGLEQLKIAIAKLKKDFDFSHSAHAITMTGELVDHFGTRKEGVLNLVKEMECVLQGAEIHYFAGEKGLVSADNAMAMYKEVASANWLASASYIATQLSDALFIDVGSTTSDVVTIQGHTVKFDGYTDAERLYAQELVYCGVVRTPIFALCKSAPIKDKFIPIINEYFASTADVYRLTKELPEHADMGDTLDGCDKDVQGSAIRLARMFGDDAVLEDLSIWQHVAEYVREQQLQMIINACRKKLLKTLQTLNTPIVGAGVGRFLVKDIAQRLNRSYIDFEQLVQYENSKAAISVGDCAPAASVACLGYQRIFS